MKLLISISATINCHSTNINLDMWFMDEVSTNGNC